MNFRSDMKVELIDHMGDDTMVCQAARVSQLGIAAAETGQAEGLIRYLMAHRHGSPFEHGSMTFLIEAPIFVFREFHRHRSGWSYNETSGRYKELAPDFYVPDAYRPMINRATSARPDMVAVDLPAYWDMHDRHEDAYGGSWLAYQGMLRNGIAKEVARNVLPVGIYSSMYATCNPRSLMHFLSLRTQKEQAQFPSYPQEEIQRVAAGMEEHFARLWPLTYAEFDKKRVAP